MVTEDFYKTKLLIALLFLYILANLGDIRNLLIWGVPGFISYLTYLYKFFHKYLSFFFQYHYSIEYKKSLYKRIISSIKAFDLISTSINNI